MTYKELYVLAGTFGKYDMRRDIEKLIMTSRKAQWDDKVSTDKGDEKECLK